MKLVTKMLKWQTSYYFEHSAETLSLCLPCFHKQFILWKIRVMRGLFIFIISLTELRQAASKHRLYNPGELFCTFAKTREIYKEEWTEESSNWKNKKPTVKSRDSYFLLLTQALSVFTFVLFNQTVSDIYDCEGKLLPRISYFRSTRKLFSGSELVISEVSIKLYDKWDWPFIFFNPILDSSNYLLNYY